MKWLKQLYVGESISGREQKLKWKINHNVGTFDIYVISFASNKDNLLDIIPAIELLQKAYPKKELFVIGLEKGYDAALEMSAAIVNDIYHKTGTFEVRKFVLKQQTHKNTEMET